MSVAKTSNVQFFGNLDDARDELEKVVDFYDEMAGEYNNLLHDSGYTQTTEYAATILKEYLQERPVGAAKEVLDVGCGTGKTGLSLKKLGLENVDGVDPSRASLEIAGKNGCYRNVFEGKITPTENLGCDDDKYDGILCLGCFTVGHIELKDGLKEFVRVLKHGGVAVYSISFTLDKALAMKDHIPFIEDGDIELLRIEKRFYHFIGKDTMYCHLYAVKKL